MEYKAFYKKRAGVWCAAVRTPKQPKPGDEIIVTTRKGKENRETVIKTFDMTILDGYYYWLCTLEGKEDQQRRRKENNLHNREEWAEKRKEKSVECASRASEMAAVIPMGQPILVGHHSEKGDRNYRSKIWNLTGKSVEHARMAEKHEETARGIKTQLNNTIYSSDSDAVKKLEEKIESLIAERDAVNAMNRAFRKAVKGWPDHVQKYYSGMYQWITRPGDDPEIERKYVLPEGVRYYPSFKNQNINGRISQARRRLEQLKKMYG